MLKYIIPTMMLMPLTWLSKGNMIWINSTTHGLLISLTSLLLMNQFSDNSLNFSLVFFSDSLSTPLLILTMWLLPLMLMASQHHLSKENLTRKKLYITMLILLQLFLIMTFTAMELIFFYILFEATLVPTLIIITRWGNQTERLNAGLYFLFYTLVGSLPLLVALLYLQNTTGSLNFLVLQYWVQPLSNSWSNVFMWLACMMAFMVKMPLYGLHLWLPKAHVEAPIAGFMVLATALLNFGCYGMLRITKFENPLTDFMGYPLILLSLWGMIMTSSICLCQTDLKSLTAYSSVSHMALFIVAILTRTPWSSMGATALMIAHSLTSSVLFCLGNSNYEQVHCQTMILAQSLQMFLLLMATWWLPASQTNLALTPTINLTGELFVVMSSFSWSDIAVILMGIYMMLPALYSLYMVITTQWGNYTHHMNSISPSFTGENALMSLPILPLLLLSLNPKIILGPLY
uniref:NADH-ubiquinone oxidoreductase chain 4 n=1 Tax=Cervus elaphus xanthopygus TaxID=9865 RepID=D3KCL5_CEREL|nr:NADH dehydrogenase subunit 4 [Cervus elaphus xanthopygus]ADC32718.1 NADH dehydrogenase subunit 4 [Cervus elaphus xanthopygus]